MALAATRLQLIAESILYVAAGWLLWTAHLHDHSFGLLAFVSTAPWLMLLVRMPTSIWLPAFSALSYFASLSIVYWLRHFDPAAWLIAPLLYLPFFVAIGFAVAFVARRRPEWPLTFVWAVIFTALEWVRARFGPGEVSLGQLGYAVAAYPYLVQVADLFGPSMLTFVLAAFGGMIVDAALWATGARAALPWRTFIVLAALTASIVAYGAFQFNRSTLVPGPTVAVIQPNLPAWTESGPMEPRLRELEGITRAAIRARTAALIVWPENSITEDYFSHETGLKEPYALRLNRLVLELDVPLLVDGPATDGNHHLHHTTTLIRPDTTPASYDKRRLVPWSEYVPFENALLWLSPRLAAHYASFIELLYPHVARTKIGNMERVRPFLIKTGEHDWLFGAPNCFEIASPSAVGEWRGPDGENRIHFLVNPANEILLGHAIHLQMLRMAQFRAVEGRTSVIRATNNGISALVDPNGVVVETLHDQADGRSVDIAGFSHFQVLVDSRNSTVYSRLGDIFPLSCLIMSAIILFIASTRSVGRRTPPK